MLAEQDTGWKQIADPNTGRPFTSYGAYSTWAQGQEAQGAAAGRDSGAAASGATPGKAPEGTYDWSGVQGYFQDPSGGNIYFGNTAANANLGGIEKTKPIYGPNGQIIGYEQPRPWEDPNYYYKMSATGEGSAGHTGTYVGGSGYIDPRTGKITWNAGQGTSGTAMGTGSASYDPSKDYGLGPSAPGVIPVDRDNSGTPTAFYAGTHGGGGKVFSTLEEATAAAQGYGSWYSSQHPTTQGKGAGGAPSAPQPRGILADPLQGEDYFADTKDFYGQTTNAQKLWDAGMDNQPTESEQHWNKYEGIFGNPAYLDDYYSRAERAAQTTLDRKAASGGWGDSGAAARATGNLGATFADRKLGGMQGFATTGSGLAATADASRRDKERGWNEKLKAAGDVDAGNLAKVLGGQHAADAAEGLTLQREGGALTSATNLGSDIATMTAAGLGQAEAARIAPLIEAIKAKMIAGNIGPEVAYKQANELFATLGMGSNYILQSMLYSKFGQGAGYTPDVAYGNPISLGGG